MRILLTYTCLILSVLTIQAQKSLHAIAAVEHARFPCCISGIEKKSDSLYYLVSDYLDKVYVASFNRKETRMTVVDSIATGIKKKSGFESVRLYDRGKKLLVAIEGDTLLRRANAKLFGAVLGRSDLNFQKLSIGDHYSDMPYNSGIESMSLSHDGKSLWVVNERPYDKGVFQGKSVLENFAITSDTLVSKATIQYLMDTALTSIAGKDNGITEILVYNADSMLVMERAYDKDRNSVSVRIFWFNIKTKTKGSQPAFVADSLVAQGLVPNVDNYEGMCSGPDHAGKKTIFIISDDNANWNYDKPTGKPKQRTDIVWLKIQ